MQGPYRPQGPLPDPELARLAAQGQQRRMEAAAGRQHGQLESGARHLRTAIGAYRGSTLKRVILACMIASLLVGAAGATISGLGEPQIGTYLIPGFVVAFFLFFLVVFIPPLASDGAIAAEHSWSASLPFRLTGYFELLSSEPAIFKVVTYEIRWQAGTRPPDQALLHSVFGAVDPDARVVHADANGARITSGRVSGFTGIRVNRAPVYRNHRVPAAVHGVADRVLAVLHRSHPIADVSLTFR